VTALPKIDPTQSSEGHQSFHRDGWVV